MKISEYYAKLRKSNYWKEQFLAGARIALEAHYPDQRFILFYDTESLDAVGEKYVEDVLKDPQIAIRGVVAILTDKSLWRDAQIHFRVLAFCGWLEEKGIHTKTQIPKNLGDFSHLRRGRSIDLDGSDKQLRLRALWRKASSKYYYKMKQKRRDER